MKSKGTFLIVTNLAEVKAKYIGSCVGKCDNMRYLFYMDIKTLLRAARHIGTLGKGANIFTFANYNFPFFAICY